MLSAPHAFLARSQSSSGPRASRTCCAASSSGLVVVTCRVGGPQRSTPYRPPAGLRPQSRPGGGRGLRPPVPVDDGPPTNEEIT